MAYKHPICAVGNIGFSLRGEISSDERQNLEQRIKEYIEENLPDISEQLSQPNCPKRSSGKAYFQLCIDRKTGDIYHNVSVLDGNKSVTKEVSLVEESSKLIKYLRAVRCMSRDLDNLDKAGQSEGSNHGVSRNTSKHNADNSPVLSVKNISDHSIEAAILYKTSRQMETLTKTKNFLCKKQYELSNKKTGILKHQAPISTQSNNDVTISKENVAKKQIGDISSKLFKPKSFNNKSQMENKSISEQTTLAPGRANVVSSTVKVNSEPKTALVSNTYDVSYYGNLFKQAFPDMKGGFEVFYDHGESHCRKMLVALGFQELKNTAEDTRYKSCQEMIVFWCNGKLAANKRRPDKMGYYIVNRIRYRGLITNKCSLVRTLAEFEATYPELVPKGLERKTFLPDSVHINSGDYMKLYDMVKSHSMFLLKPGYTDCGKGITLYRSDGTVKSLSEFLTKEYNNYTARDLMLQVYIENPLLLEKKKFDLRVFLLIIPNQQKDAGVYAFFHPGYVRLACRDFSLKSNNLLIHLTNQAIQCKDRLYSATKEKTVWSPDLFNEYLNNNLTNMKVPCKDWVYKMLIPRIKAVLAHIVSIASSSMVERTMAFELFGCDFLIDDDFSVWLLEINSDPSLCKSTSVLQQIISQVTEEAIAVAVEVLQRSVRKIPIRNMVTLQDFTKIFSHNNDSVIKSIFSRIRVRLPSITQSTDNK